ncbi:MAG: TonB-dependent receptor [Bacteroidia bacterium]|nr:TonB-dependent receptor [Bacteroidia bacterium]
MREVFVAVIICCLSISVNAQNLVEGFILDNEKQIPVVSAEVVDVSNPDNTVFSDSTGWFSINTNSKSLEISHISYVTETINVEKFENGTRIFMVSGSGTLLNQAVVGADRMTRTMKEQIVSVDIVQPDLIEDKNPIYIDEIVNQVSGVVISDNQVNIRNGAGWSYGAGTRALVMVDGMPLISGDAGSVQWNFISTDNIRSMEVVKGASSVLYGSSALNGMVNIRTGWASNTPKTTVTLFGGQYGSPSRSTLKWTDKNLYSNGLRILDSRKKGRNDFVTTFELIGDDGYRMGDFDRRMHAGFDYRRRTKSGLQFGAKTHLLTTENGSFLLWQSYDSAYTALNRQITTTNGTKFRIDPFLKYRTKKGWTHNLKTRFFSLDNRVDNGDPDNDQSNTSTTFFVDYQSSVRLPLRLRLTYGGTFISTRTKSPLFNGEQFAGNRALYAQLDQKIRKLSYTFGYRLENYSLNDYRETKPVVRAGINYELSKATFLRASYGQGFRFPTIAESFIKTSVGLVSVYPNEQLRSETGDNLEVGIKQGFKAKRIKGFIDLALFRMSYQNMMEFTFGQWSSDISADNGFGLGFKSLNTGETTIEGVDVSTTMEMKLGKGKLRLFGGYTASVPVANNPTRIFGRDSVGNELSFNSTSSDTTDAILKYRSLRTFKMDAGFSSRRWDIGISWRYNSQIQNVDQAFVGPLFGLFVPGIEESLALNPKGVWVTDVRVAYKIGTRYRVALIANNLANTEYVIRPADIGAPRLVMVQLKLVI